jgi:diguanylate cyclase (GGDEF)-like protein
MRGYPLPENETERLAKLRGYEILDSLPEAAYDRITRLAARMFNVPTVLISLIEDERQWFKAKIGIDVQEVPRKISFCAHTICQNDIFVIENAEQDRTFSCSPFVTGEAHLRFYAGAPLRTPDGMNVGTLAIIDKEPRAFGEDDKQVLADLAAMVIDTLEMRLLIDKAERAERRLVDAMESLPSGFVLYDQDDRLVLCNQRYRELYAKSASAIVPGAPFEEIIRKGVELGQYPDAAGNEDAWIAERLEMHRNPGDPIEQHLPDDRWLRIQERCTSEGGRVGFRIDITTLKRQERELARLAWTDSLTGALNRHRFIELAGKEIDRTRRHACALSLLLVDADHFKQINDRNGHAAGDAVLEGMVQRWTKVLRSHDLIGRIGGEEFAILLPEVGEAGALRAAERLRLSIAELPFAFEGQLLRATISIGIAPYRSGDELAVMMKRADDALYRAKETGRDRFVMGAA